jgi:hypothetical protein
MNLFDKSKPTLTYVSCFVNINCKEPHKTHQWRMDNFTHIAKTGVPIVLYVDKEIKEVYQKEWQSFNNVVLRDVDYSKSWTYKVCSLYKNNLPASRNMVKDSFLFLCLMNMKVEFVVNAVNENPFDTNHFAWIDFNLSHIFKQKTATSNYMQFLTTCKWAPRFIANPGCWERGQGIENIVDHINWRFCGGFMIGDGQSFIELFDLYLEHFTIFMHRFRHITWEVNFWAWLEVNASWSIVWFKADHDDSIVRIPSHLFSRCLGFNRPTFRYKFPEEPGFYPSSISYIKVPEGQHILNVRYVNYKLDDYGRYHINHPSGHLETKNLRCFLADDLETIKSHEFVWEGMIGLPEYDKSITGLEDVRLYYSGDKLKYVATNKSYHILQKIRIMVGDYSASMAMFENGQVLEPPTDTNCEKNWIPLGAVGSGAALELRTVGSGAALESFIYRWAPFEIGHVEGDTLKITKSIPVEHMLLQKIRGSTPPVWSQKDQCYYCVVHYCEHIHGDKTLSYYHMLVKLDTSYEPFEWSDVFHFNHIGIQYCIGFTILEEHDNDKTFGFWFSQHDGNPGFIRFRS